VKIYVDRVGDAPSPRRVRIYLAEKELDVPYEPLEIHKENRTEAFRRKNALSTLPVLELDDGRCIAESIAICRYFEVLHPEPALFGTDAFEQAEVEMWLRRVELRLYLAIEFAGDGVFPPDLGPRFRRAAAREMDFLDEELRERNFIAGAGFSIADIVALCALDFGIAHNGFEIPEGRQHLARWHRRVSARASASA
jgi:glutathione S-transferase